VRAGPASAMEAALVARLLLDLEDAEGVFTGVEAQAPGGQAGPIRRGYLRFTGPMTVTAFQASSQIERYTQDAIWDLAYFGHARPPAAG
jgi:hypothetical protein